LKPTTPPFFNPYIDLNQSIPYNNFSIVSGDNEVLWELIILPLALKVDVEVTIVIGVNKISLATLDKIQYFKVLAFHHSNALNSKPFSRMNTLSSKYMSKYGLICCYTKSIVIRNDSNKSI
jgi:hypothetical protein